MRRRDFLKSLSAAGLVGFSPVSAEAAGESPQLRGRVVMVQRPGVVDAQGRADAVKLSNMLDAAVERLFEEEADKIWRTLFSPRDVVGLKVNCLAGRGLSTRIELTQAVVDRLTKAGVPHEQIIIWDRRDRDLQRAGYTLNSGKGVQCCGNDRAGFTEQVYEFGAAASQLSLTLMRCTAVINLPILKDHGIVGMSGALKNFFGAVNNPNKYHMNCGDPFVADVNCLPPIRRKVRLTICDALTAQYEGGPPFMPEYTWRLESLLVAIDMAALDRIAWQMIDEKRRQVGLPTLEKAGRKPTYILTAGDSAHRLGETDPIKIDWIRI
ncbi:MAG: DUF362 domain-containing protein [candidate division KSB1 bacterium]|nr:DUF362 domain-containing protein [candidate division KSB1 bacterium]